MTSNTSAATNGAERKGGREAQDNTDPPQNPLCVGKVIISSSTIEHGSNPEKRAEEKSTIPRG